MDKNLVVVLFGASGSGKSFYKKYFVECGFYEIKSYTTREKRKDEKDEYHFISNIEWVSLSSSNKLVNCNNYHGSYYGILLEDLKVDKPSVLISDITSLEDLQKTLFFLDKKSIFIYCEVPQNLNILEQRHLQRGTQNRFDISKKEIKEFEKEKQSDWWEKNIHFNFIKLKDAEDFIKKIN